MAIALALYLDEVDQAAPISEDLYLVMNWLYKEQYPQHQNYPSMNCVIVVIFLKGLIILVV